MEGRTREKTPPPVVASVRKHRPGRLTDEEKAARLAEMTGDAELHEEARWQRLREVRAGKRWNHWSPGDFMEHWLSLRVLQEREPAS